MNNLCFSPINQKSAFPILSPIEKGKKLRFVFCFNVCEILYITTGLYYRCYTEGAVTFEPFPG